MFETDLSEKNAKALRKTFEPWVASARRVSSRKVTRRPLCREEFGKPAC